MEKQMIVYLKNSLEAKDCFDGLRAEADDPNYGKKGHIIAFGCRIANIDDYIEISSPVQSKIDDLVKMIEDAYDVQYVIDPSKEEYDSMNYPDSYEMDNHNYQTWKENMNMKMSIRNAKKLLESNGYTVRRPIDEEFDYNTASPEDQERYDTAVANLTAQGAARPGFGQRGEASWDDDGFATDFKNSTRFLRVAINADFKNAINQKYGYPPQEIVQLASQALPAYLEACAGTPDPEEFRAYLEENVL